MPAEILREFVHHIKVHDVTELTRKSFTHRKSVSISITLVQLNEGYLFGYALYPKSTSLVKTPRK